MPDKKCRRCGPFLDEVCVKCLNPRGTKPAAPAAGAGPDAAPLSIVTSAECAPLPAHSPLGASGMERWSKCSGSVKLAELMRQFGIVRHEDPDFTTNGINAHALAAHCLQTGFEPWMLIGQPGWDFVDLEMVNAVSVFVNYVWAQGGKLSVEQRMHKPEIHPLCYGTLDASMEYPASSPIALEIADYKNGAGVVVEVEDNMQTMYYAVMKLQDYPHLIDSDTVKLTIVQPNAFHPDGPIRSWLITVHDLRAWIDEQMRPAFERASTTVVFELGEHCRFCPAKTLCPAMDDLAKRVLDRKRCTYAEAQILKMLVKQADKDELATLLGGGSTTGGKLVAARVYRAWKDGAEAVLTEKLGKDAWEPPKLRSPAQIEDLPMTKDIVAEWAVTPQAGLTVAPLADKRKEMKPRDATGVFGTAVQKVLDAESVPA